ncbi:alpha/beta hydrolase [Streptomyces sp. NPDC101132]|uniref:alpha/beta hydrolase n=1 Tax=Streptomyces sp. NPDC101132 TaxID=3366110 RepID=UPI00380668B5
MQPMASLLGAALGAGSYVAPALTGRAAFHLFVRPAGRSTARPEEAALMREAVVGQLRVDGLAVATYRWGSGGRPVLLVHGWSSRAAKFAGFVRALRERGHTVVAFDAPGHGASAGRATNIRQMRDAIRQLQEENGEFTAVVAHSFGVLATFFALRGGVRADRVVALGGVADFDYLLERFSARLGLGPRVQRALRAHVEEKLFPGEPGIWDRLAATHRPDETGVRVLLLHDADDEVAAPAQARAIAAAYGDRARLVETRGLGHRRILHDPRVIESAVAFAVTDENLPSAVA